MSGTMKVATLVIVALALTAAPLVSQVQSGATVAAGTQFVADPGTSDSEARNPDVARRRALLFPGGGQFYAGETNRGALLLGGSVAAVGLGLALRSSGDSYTHGDPCFYEPSGPGCKSSSSRNFPLYLGLATAAGLWVYGYMDADDSVRRSEQRTRLALNSLRFRPEPLVDRVRDDVTVGLQLRAAW